MTNAKRQRIIDALRRRHDWARYMYAHACAKQAQYVAMREYWGGVERELRVRLMHATNTEGGKQ